MNTQKQKSPNNTNTNNGTPSVNPLTAARERLQSSARDLFRSFEDAVRVPRPIPEAGTESKGDTGSRRRELQPTLREGAASIEHALRVMFSSCTGAADAGSTPEKSLSDLQFLTITPSKDSAVLAIVTPPTASTLHESPHTSSHRRTSPSQRDMGEHIYAQLFHDDTVRAEKAVEIRRGYETPEQDERQRHAASPRPLSKPFPISTPPRTFSAPSQELHVPASLTFDDAISAISAHTLEAMVDTPNPISRIEHTRKTKETVSAVHLSEPDSFVRVRSSGSHSRFSLPSKGNNSRQSKTTQTTESSGSSFEIWQAQEQKFWDDMVHQDGPRQGHLHDTFSACFDENPFIQPVVREDISYLPGTFLEEEEFDFANMGEI